jgi:hypothetical protein
LDLVYHGCNAVSSTYHSTPESSDLNKSNILYKIDGSSSTLHFTSHLEQECSFATCSVVTANFISSKDWLDFFKQKGRMWLGTKLILGIGGLLGSQYAYVSYIAYSDDRKLKWTLESGSCPAIEVEHSEFVDRLSLVKDLTRMLAPTLPKERHQ